MSPEQRKKAAKRAVDSILRDLTDRRGLRQEWDGIDSSTRAAIRRNWATRISNEFSDTALSAHATQPSGDARRKENT